MIAVSLLADGAVFFVTNYRMYLLKDTSVQFVLVYIWSVRKTIKKEVTIDTADTAKKLNFWQKLLKLFGLYKE